MPNLFCHLKHLRNIYVLLTYKSKDIGVQDFIGQIVYLITLHNPDLVLADFNINALKNSPLLNTMKQSDYTLLGSGPTYIMGTLLDHVYIKEYNFFGKLTL